MPTTPSRPPSEGFAAALVVPAEVGVPGAENRPATFTVTSAADDGTAGTFRYALQQLNASNDSTNTIDFAIGASGSLQTITVNQSLGQLPIIEKPVTIDGYSQGSSSGPLIQLNGTSTSMIPGLDVSVGGVTIQDLAIYGFMGSGVYINNEETPAGDVVRGCYVGTDANGDSGLGNGTGVDVLGSGDTIGGPQSTDANVISGNKQDGVLLEASSSLVMNDRIGVSPSGTSALANGTGVLVEGINDTVGDATGAVMTLVSGNTNDGIDVSGSGALITNAWVGVGVTGLAALSNGGNGIDLNGDGSSDYDVVSGNAGYGISVTGSSNVVYGDDIGVGADGVTQAANGFGGVFVSGSSHDRIGSSTAGDRNIISGNGGNGVTVSDSSDETIAGNYIGLDKNGNKQGDDGAGVLIGSGAHDNTVGGITAGDGNLISGNGAFGVEIDGAQQNVIAGNYIGTDKLGATAIPNASDGVKIDDGATANTVGGTTASALNVISGNGANGVYISNSGTSQNVVVGNYIGTDVTGTTATGKDNKPLGNASDGVKIDDGATANTVGGTTAGALNVISGNGDDGVAITDTGTSNNLVEGDYIGTDVSGTTATDSKGNSIGNVINGVEIKGGATANTIGGTVAGSLNVISGNKDSGVRITDNGTSKNVVAGDYIGTDVLGGTHIANGWNGVTIQNGASNNTIGALAVKQNGVDTTVTVISGNTDAGVAIYYTGNHNQVINCYIGTDKNGMKKVGNLLYGIDLEGTENTIGGTVNSTNVISGNGNGTWNANSGFGIYATGAGASDNVIEGDYIGTTNTGTAALGNDNSGVYVSADGGGNTIGGTVQAAMCVISSNGAASNGANQPSYGVDLTNSTGETVEGNNIGVDVNGKALPNKSDWIFYVNLQNTITNNNHQ